MHPAVSGKAGAHRPGPLSFTYSRVPHQALRLALESGMPMRWAVLFMLCSFIYECDGILFASCSREMICKELGLTGAQVKNAVDFLKAKGLLSVSRRGRNGRSTLYSLNLNAASGAYPSAVNAVSGTYPTKANAAPETYPKLPDSEVEMETRLLGPTLQGPYRGPWSLPLTNCSKEQFVVEGDAEDEEAASEEPPLKGGFLSGREEFPPADIIHPVSHEEGESLASIAGRGDSR